MDNNIKNLLQSLNIDHLDFGCSKGGSLAFARKHLGGNQGLGIDIDNAKVQETRAAGFHALNYDILEIPNEQLVRFVVMSHFLEHIPSLALVKQLLRKACVISSEFVYIQQPFFDADSYLFERGLKLFWSDWTGHQNRMTSLELWLALRDLQNEGLPITFSLHAHKPITDSDNPCIHSIESPKDQHDYILGKHPAKHTLKFENNVFSELVCLISMPGFDHEAMLHKLRYHTTIISADKKSLRPRARIGNLLTKYRFRKK
jgi:hypothetical protein